MDCNKNPSRIANCITQIGSATNNNGGDQASLQGATRTLHWNHARTMSTETHTNCRKHAMTKKQVSIKPKHIRRVFLTRDAIERFIYLPRFEKTVTHCFVRVLNPHIKSPYQLGQIVGTSKAKATCKLPQKECCDALLVHFGKVMQRIDISSVSNEGFTKGEFRTWKASSSEMPSQKLLKKKRRHIAKANKNCGMEDVGKMTNEKCNLRCSDIRLESHGSKKNTLSKQVNAMNHELMDEMLDSLSKLCIT